MPASDRNSRHLPLDGVRVFHDAAQNIVRLTSNDADLGPGGLNIAVKRDSSADRALRRALRLVGVRTPESAVEALPQHATYHPDGTGKNPVCQFGTFINPDTGKPHPMRDELESLWVVGSPGSGKTQLLRALALQLVRKTFRVTVADPTGQYADIEGVKVIDTPGALHQFLADWWDDVEASGRHPERPYRGEPHYLFVDHFDYTRFHRADGWDLLGNAVSEGPGFGLHVVVAAQRMEGAAQRPGLVTALHESQSLHEAGVPDAHFFPTGVGAMASRPDRPFRLLQVQDIKRHDAERTQRKAEGESPSAIAGLASPPDRATAARLSQEPQKRPPAFQVGTATSADGGTVPVFQNMTNLLVVGVAGAGKDALVASLTAQLTATTGARVSVVSTEGTLPERLRSARRVLEEHREVVASRFGLGERVLQHLGVQVVVLQDLTDLLDPGAPGQDQQLRTQVLRSLRGLLQVGATQRVYVVATSRQAPRFNLSPHFHVLPLKVTSTEEAELLKFPGADELVRRTALVKVKGDLTVVRLLKAFVSTEAIEVAADNCLWADLVPLTTPAPERTKQKSQNDSVVVAQRPSPFSFPSWTVGRTEDGRVVTRPMSHLLFVGPPKSGLTTAARLVAAQLRTQWGAKVFLFSEDSPYNFTDEELADLTHPRDMGSDLQLIHHEVESRRAKAASALLFEQEIAAEHLCPWVVVLDNSMIRAFTEDTAVGKLLESVLLLGPRYNVWVIVTKTLSGTDSLASAARDLPGGRVLMSYFDLIKVVRDEGSTSMRTSMLLQASDAQPTWVHMGEAGSLTLAAAQDVLNSGERDPSALSD